MARITARSAWLWGIVAATVFAVAVSHSSRPTANWQREAADAAAQKPRPALHAASGSDQGKVVQAAHFARLPATYEAIASTSVQPPRVATVQRIPPPDSGAAEARVASAPGDWLTYPLTAMSGASAVNSPELLANADNWPPEPDPLAIAMAERSEGPLLTAPSTNIEATRPLAVPVETVDYHAQRVIPQLFVAEEPNLGEQGSQEAQSLDTGLANLVFDWNHDSSLRVVSSQANLLIERALSLAEKGALYSARAEFFAALQTISKALDARNGTSAFSQALAEGRQTLTEAQDFVAGGSAKEINVHAIVATHRTPLLKRTDTRNMPAVVATQRYFAYAQEKLTRAAGGAPLASRAYFGLGKTYAAIAEQSPDADRLNGPQALAFQQTALLIDPRNYLAANELGVLMARFGQLEEARRVLQQSIVVHPIPEAWHNLAVVHQRLGEQDLAALAHNELLLARQQSSSAFTTPAARSPMVQWVDPAGFSQGGPVPVAVPVPQAPPRTAATGSGFWPR